MKLLIPGPVTTAPAVRAAMAVDYAPWDRPFRDLVARVRRRITAAAGGTDETHLTVIVQGCGHYAIEAALRAFVPADRKLLVPVTGAYGERFCRLAHTMGLTVVELPVAEGTRVDPVAFAAALDADPAIGFAGLVYSETGTGVVHDVPALGAIARTRNVRTIVDAVSAFGALPLDVSAMPEADAVIATANKCLEGTPGIGLAVARVDRLRAPGGTRRSWSLDLGDAYAHAMAAGLGAFSFTPPAQTIAALDVALDLYDAEGRAARLARYQRNAAVLHLGVRELGLVPCVDAATQGPIIVNVYAPDHPAWDLEVFVALMRERGFVVSNYYNTRLPSFRLGCIGQVFEADMRAAVGAIGESLDVMGIVARRVA